MIEPGKDEPQSSILLTVVLLSILLISLAIVISIT